MTRATYLNTSFCAELNGENTNSVCENSSKCKTRDRDKKMQNSLTEEVVGGGRRARDLQSFSFISEFATSSLSHFLNWCVGGGGVEEGWGGEGGG